MFSSNFKHSIWYFKNVSLKCLVILKIILEKITYFDVYKKFKTPNVIEF